jgi:hypothetical protein
MTDKQKREARHARAWAEMRERAEEFAAPRDARGEALDLLLSGIVRHGLPACHGQGRGGAL